MSNFRSLANENRRANGVGKNMEYLECIVMCFMETWLHQEISDNNDYIDGFWTVWVYNDCNESFTMSSSCLYHKPGSSEGHPALL